MSRKTYSWHWNAAIVVAINVVAWGCGRVEPSPVPVVPVKGAITFRGKPIGGAFVSLHPVEPIPDAPNPRATAGPDGSFVFTTFRHGDGAPEGDYYLTAAWYRPIPRDGELTPGPNALPRRFESPRTSRIQVRVASSNPELPTIDLR